MTRSFFTASAFAITALLAGCTVTSGYQTVALDDEFASSADVVPVRAPVRRYRDDFFNLPLGDYRAINVAITTPVKSEREYVKSKTVNTTGWNLLLQGQLIPEKKTYKQYMVVTQREFSFQVTTEQGVIAESSCQYASSMLENEESGSTTLLLNSTGKRNPGAESIDYADWLQTVIKCDIRQAGKQWQVGIVESHDADAIIELETQGKTYRGQRLLDSFSELPASSGPDSEVLDGSLTGALAGVAFYDGAAQVSAVSLVEGNNAIWSAASLSTEESVAMLGIGYSLILASWHGVGELLD